MNDCLRICGNTDARIGRRLPNFRNSLPHPGGLQENANKNIGIASTMLKVCVPALPATGYYPTPLDRHN